MIKLSLIIPTFNRATELRTTLLALLNQTISQEFYEIIIIDNNSNDDTAKVAQEFSERFVNFIYKHEPKLGLHHARHTGLNIAKSDKLVYCDDDITADPNWLNEILKSFEESTAELIGGKILPNFTEEPPLWLKEKWNNQPAGKRVLFYLSLIDLGEETKYILPHQVYGCNFATYKETIIKAGGFHPDYYNNENELLTGDGETAISRYLARNNIKALYNPKIKVFHRISHNRMSKEYVLRRLYLAGISSSFVHTRESYLKGVCYKHSLRDVLRRFYYQYLISNYSTLNKQINKSYWNGYYTHQRAIKNNPELHQWVIRKDYY